MIIDEELINLCTDFKRIGTVTGSVSSLDERGRDVVILRKPAMGGIDSKSSIAISRTKFKDYYTQDNAYGFNLFALQ